MFLSNNIVIKGTISSTTSPASSGVNNIVDSLSQSSQQEEEPLGLAGLEQLLRADIGSILPVGFGQKEDLVQAKSIHSLGEPDWSVTNNYLTLPLPPDYPNRQ